MLANSMGATPALALTWKPVPGVEKTAPRGEFTLKKFAGRMFGAEKASGTPSQLISRRPVANDPAVLGLRGPRAVRYASTADWIDAASAPAALKLIAAPNAVEATSPNATAKRSLFLMRITP